MHTNQSRLAAAGVVALALSSTAFADGERVRSGGVGCGGQYVGNTQATNWTLRNWNEDATITLERVRFYDAQGQLLYDSAVSGIPVTDNTVLGPTDNTLEAHQTTIFSTDQLQAVGVLPPLAFNQRPMQLVVDWSAGRSRAAPTSPPAASFRARSRSTNPPDGGLCFRAGCTPFPASVEAL